MLSNPNRAAKHAALPLAACAVAALSVFAAPPALAQSLQAHRIVIDKDPGRARAPEHDEIAAAAASARTAARSSGQADASVKAALQSHPAAQLLQAQPLAAQFGAKGHRVDASRLSFTVLNRNAGGQMSSQCVTGEAAMATALKGDTLGGQHEH